MRKIGERFEKPAKENGGSGGIALWGQHRFFSQTPTHPEGQKTFFINLKHKLWRQLNIWIALVQDIHLMTKKISLHGKVLKITSKSIKQLTLYHDEMFGGGGGGGVKAVVSPKKTTAHLVRSTWEARQAEMVLKQILLKIGGLYCRVMKQDSAKSLQRYCTGNKTSRTDLIMESRTWFLFWPFLWSLSCTRSCRISYIVETTVADSKPEPTFSVF